MSADLSHLARLTALLLPRHLARCPPHLPLVPLLVPGHLDHLDPYLIPLTRHTRQSLQPVLRKRQTDLGWQLAAGQKHKRAEPMPSCRQTGSRGAASIGGTAPTP